MKKCPVCKEEYQDYADSCPKCEINLDTGEKLGIDQCIDLSKLQKEYKNLTLHFKVFVGCMMIFFVCILLPIIFRERMKLIIEDFLGIAAIISFFASVAVFSTFQIRISALFKAMGEGDVINTFFTWLFPLVLGIQACSKARTILKKSKNQCNC